jgi:hypothetical protein
MVDPAEAIASYLAVFGLGDGDVVADEQDRAVLWFWSGGLRGCG